MSEENDPVSVDERRRASRLGAPRGVVRASSFVASVPFLWTAACFGHGDDGAKQTCGTDPRACQPAWDGALPSLADGEPGVLDAGAHESSDSATESSVWDAGPSDAPLGQDGGDGGPAVPRYALTELALPPLPGAYGCEARGVNDDAVVAGMCLTPGPSHAIVWDHGAVIDLGDLSGQTGSEAHRVNNQGVVVGRSGRFGFVWDAASGMTALYGGCFADGGCPPPTSLGAEAWSIANDGTVGGKAQNYGPPPYPGTATLWSPPPPPMRGVTALGTVDGNAVVNGISATGLAVGTHVSLTDPNTYHPFVWRSGVPTDLGSLGPSQGSARAVNAFEQVVGVSGGDAFLWQNGTMTALPRPAGRTLADAKGINDAGLIVGLSETIPVLWVGGQVYDLLTLVQGGTAWVDGNATDISNTGVIVGFGMSPTDHVQHGFLLTPLP